jgi:hypothetical protein
MKTTTAKAIIPSWEGVRYIDIPSTPSYTVSLIGATEKVNGGTHIKKNSAPTHSADYDVRCDSEGNLSGVSPLTDATKVYIWGYAYTLDGSYYECEPIYDNATEIEISEDTEIVLWGANSE